MYKISSKSQVVRIKLLVKLFVLIFTVHCSVFPFHSYSQGLGINISGSPANSKALLDIDATGMSPKAGVLLPRMTTAERDAITSPIPESLLIFNTDTHCFEAYYNGGWVAFGCLGSGCSVPSAPSAGTNTPTANQITWNWNTVSGATGYKWNTNEVEAEAKDLGQNTSYTLTGLTCGTTYTLYVWAYNTCGNSTVTTMTQTTSACTTCGGVTQVLYDGGPHAGYYYTVAIGTQCWLKENLNCGTQQTLLNSNQALGIGNKYCRDDIAGNCTIYGGFYEWAQASVICPSGWHLPTHDEWTTLEKNLGTNPGAFPYDITTSAVSLGTDEGTNIQLCGSSNFCALLGGDAYSDINNPGYSTFPNFGPFTAFWTSTSDNTGTNAWMRSLNPTNSPGKIWRNMTLKSSNGFSVRCLKN